MSIRNRQAGHASHERWLVSYADFITLMFAFFVVMFASSQTDKAKAKQVSESVREAIDKGGITAAVREVLGGTVDDKGRGNAMMKGPGGAQKGEQSNRQQEAASGIAELLPSLNYLTRQLREEINTGKVQIRLQPRGLVVSLRQAAFFPSGEDTVDPASYPSIEKIAGVLRSLPNSVRLEGHTDSVPIHNPRFRSNWELSAARSIAMLNVLGDHFGIPREKMAIAGYADTVPVDSNETEAGRTRNRRVDIVILGQHAATVEPIPEPAGAKQAATRPAPQGAAPNLR